MQLIGYMRNFYIKKILWLVLLQKTKLSWTKYRLSYAKLIMRKSICILWNENKVFFSIPTLVMNSYRNNLLNNMVHFLYSLNPLQHIFLCKCTLYLVSLTLDSTILDYTVFFWAQKSCSSRPHCTYLNIRYHMWMAPYIKGNRVLL